ncbi:MAG: ATP-binding cassette domain-containing protein, partial [Anaerolineae bacterium]|nr:ATP-binding cassette domain-containing protein [Anaerolineae bacterium]
LVGPNGAGKSALLSLILGDHPQAYANSIALFGRARGSGESIWEIKRRIGWVSPELHRYHPPHTTPLDIVCSGYFDSIGLHRRCTDEQRTHALQWIKRMGLEDVAHSPFRHLPKGRQRLALIARALVKDPELLILDEPCQGLDPAHLEEVLRALDEVTLKSDRTLIYVTHRPSEFPKGLTHILELTGGRVVHQGVFGP